MSFSIALLLFLLYVLFDVGEADARQLSRRQLSEDVPCHVERVADLAVFLFALFEEPVLKDASEGEEGFVGL